MELLGWLAEQTKRRLRSTIAYEQASAGRLTKQTAMPKRAGRKVSDKPHAQSFLPVLTISGSVSR
jgi:hypothetical protein